MARLSKEDLGARGKFIFKQEDVDLPELNGGEGATVLVRTPTVGQRDELGNQVPAKPEDWTLQDTARLFALIVVDPEVTQQEAAEFLPAWPGPALDKIIAKFAELTGTKEEIRQAAGDFRGSE